MQIRNNYRVATFSQHHYPGHRPFSLMALKVSHSSRKQQTLSCAAQLFAITPLALCYETDRCPQAKL